MSARTPVWSQRPDAFFGLLRLAGIAVLAAVICWYFGAGVWQSMVLAIPATALVVALAGEFEVGDSRWRTESVDRSPGSWREVQERSLALRGRLGGKVGKARAAGRVRDLGRARLEALGLDLLEPSDRQEIERLIGPGPLATLVRVGRRPPTLTALLRCLDALDRLDENRAGARMTSRVSERPRWRHR